VRGGKHVIKCSFLLASLYLIGEPSSPISGYLSQQLGLELTWLTRPLMVYVALRLPAALLTDNEEGVLRALGLSLTGLALSYLAWSFLGRGSQPILCVILGWLLRRLAGLSGGPWIRASVNALGIASIAYGSWSALNDPLGLLPTFALKVRLWGPLRHLSPLAEAPSAIAEPFSLGVAATALASLLEPLSSSDNEILARLGKWARTSKLKSFLSGFALGLYVLRVRPYLIGSWGYAYLIEWAALGVVVARVVDGVRTRLKSLTVKGSLYALYGWERPYRLEVRSERGEELELAEELMNAFLERGLKTPLIAYMSALLNDVGATFREIAYVIEPLASHSDEPVPLVAFGFEKDLVARGNRARREEALNLTLSRLAEWAESKGVKLRWLGEGGAAGRGKR